MNEWTECTLGDLIHVKHGFAFLGEHFTDRGSHVVLTPGNFFERGGFRAKGEKEKRYTGPIPADYILQEGNVLVAMTEQAEGLLGSSAIIPADDLYLHNQRLGLVQVRDESQADLGFVFHLFNSPTVRQQIRGSATGTKVRHTSPSRIASVHVRVPPLATQRRIAGILSAYDDLLANCERRIRVLDEQARALYREWFVLFRYPGHENVPLIESSLGPIPRGWEVKTLREVANIKWGDTSTTKARYVEDGYDAYSASGLDGKLDHYDFDRKGIVLSAIGAQCGKMWLARGKWSCIKNTIRFWPTSDDASIEFMFVATGSQDFWPRRGAAQPFISQGDAERQQILIPDRERMMDFTRFVSDALEQAAFAQRASPEPPPHPRPPPPPPPLRPLPLEDPA